MDLHKLIRRGQPLSNLSEVVHWHTVGSSASSSLGYDESVFINDLASPNVSIFNPQQEIRFAGVPTLGAAWLLAKRKGESVDMIHCNLGGNVRTSEEDKLTWISANLDVMPPWHHMYLDSIQEVESITVAEGAAMEHTMVWAWLDEAKGMIRARTFASDWGIPEAQGNGSGSMMLSALLNRNVEIRHGQGSVIFAKQSGLNIVDVGGRVVKDNSFSLAVN
jgi:predicted PhzF superfamily epimerase YddE/YHI9